MKIVTKLAVAAALAISAAAPAFASQGWIAPHNELNINASYPTEDAMAYAPRHEVTQDGTRAMAYAPAPQSVNDPAAHVADY